MSDRRTRYTSRYTTASPMMYFECVRRRDASRGTPLEMLRTETGGRLVDQMLIEIDEGMIA